MAMLEYSEIKERKVIIHDEEPWEVVSSHVFRKQQRKPVNATKLKNLLTGRMAEVSFHVSDKVEEAELEKRKIKFLYENKGEYWFAEESDPAKRFTVGADKIGNPQIKFLKVGLPVDLLTFEDEDGEEILISVELPVKMDFEIKEAPPSIKGNTATGGSKVVVLENGSEINVPLFFEAGDKIKVNTETGEYVERAS